MDLFRKTLKPVEQVLKTAGVNKEEVDDVSLTFTYVLQTLSLIIVAFRSFL